LLANAGDVVLTADRDSAPTKQSRYQLTTSQNQLTIKQIVSRLSEEHVEAKGKEKEELEEVQ
jgi:hypothetical protein